MIIIEVVVEVLANTYILITLIHSVMTFVFWEIAFEKEVCGECTYMFRKQIIKAKGSPFCGDE